MTVTEWIPPDLTDPRISLARAAIAKALMAEDYARIASVSRGVLVYQEDGGEWGKTMLDAALKETP